MLGSRPVLYTMIVLAPVGVAVAWLGLRQQRRFVDGTVADLGVPSSGSQEVSPSPEALEDLPKPVRRYLAWALPEPRWIRVARLFQIGEVRTDPGKGRWMSFEAEHLAVTTPLGFVWDARVSVVPLVHIRVVDALVQGVGSGRVSLMSVVPMGSEAGSEEINSGALHRYLAEAVWYPSALWPSRRLRWTPIDDDRALATLKGKNCEVSLEFRFRSDGAVLGIYTPARWGKFDDGFRQVAWEGHFADYRVQDGVRIPMEGEVGWYVNGNWEAVWTGTLTKIEYEFVD